MEPHPLQQQGYNPYLFQISCEKCVFAQTENSGADQKPIQTGCDLDRCHKLKIHQQLPHVDTGYYLLPRFCNTYRPESWLETIDGDKKEVVMEEVYPKVGFFIFFKEDSEDPIGDLAMTLEDIKSQNTISPRYIVVINDKFEYNLEINELLVHNFDWDITEYHIVMRFDCDDDMLKIDTAYQNAKNGWIYVGYAGKSISRNLLMDIHHRVNIKMERLVVVMPKPDDGINGLLFQSSVFHVLHGNAPVKTGDGENVDTRTFLERLDLMPSNDKNTKITWEQFYGRA